MEAGRHRRWSIRRWNVGLGNDSWRPLSPKRPVKGRHRLSAALGRTALYLAPRGSARLTHIFQEVLRLTCESCRSLASFAIGMEEAWATTFVH